MSETPGADVSADVVERLAKVVSDAWDDYLGTERLSEVPVAWVDGRVYKEGPMARARAVVAHLRAHPEDAAAVLAEGAAVRTEGRIWGSEDTTNVAPQWHEASADFIQAHVGLWPAQVRTVICGPWREVPTREENA